MDFFSPSLVQTYQEILKATPESTAFCPLAQIYRLRKDLKLAEKTCFQGLMRNPNHWGGYVALAQIYRDKGDWMEAVKYLNRAKNIDPDNPKTYEILGEIYRDRNDIPNSLAAFKMVLFLKPWSQFAEQMVQQLESSASLKTEESHSLSQSKAEGESEDSLFQLSKERKVKKLQKLLARIEQIMAETALAN